MSTRCTIYIKYEDGSKKGIYCHHDGYIESVGVMLQAFYSTPEKVEELLKLGDLSSLYSTPERCIAYHRDRGEKFHQTIDLDEEFVYMYDNEERLWYVTMDDYSKTEASIFLCCECCTWARHRLLLLDAIIKSEANKYEYDGIRAGEAVQKCKDAAIDARRDLIEAANEAAWDYFNAYRD